MRARLVLLVAILALGLPATAPADNATQMRAVVLAWSARLNADDNKGLARLFTVPALVIQAPYAFRLRTRAEIAKWYAGLPCSGHVVSITVRGRFATAVFKLGNRGASACDAPGTLAAARFEIVNGKIRTWQQVDVPAPTKPSGNVA